MHHNPLNISNIFKFINFFLNSSDPDSNFLTYMHKKSNNTLFLRPTDPQEILTIVSKLSNSCSKDINNISNKLLKLLIDPLAEVLSYLFNLSFEKGTFPNCFKTTKVVPIFKSGCSHEVGNYRPISIISSISKVLEKLAKIRLTLFLSKNELLVCQQFGFRQGLSTEIALTAFLNDVYKNCNLGLYSLSVFIDFTKAFDSIKHSILLKKLELYGIRGIPLSYFHSYLENRQ